MPQENDEEMGGRQIGTADELADKLRCPTYACAETQNGRPGSNTKDANSRREKGKPRQRQSETKKQPWGLADILSELSNR